MTFNKVCRISDIFLTFVFHIDLLYTIRLTMRKLYLLLENVRISLQAIRSSKLRTVLTVFIIAIGIMALVGILTAIDAIKSSISTSFMTLGANTFTIQGRTVTTTSAGRQPVRNYAFISYNEARDFSERFDFPATVSISTQASGQSIIRYGSNESNPTVNIIGVDENYLFTSGYDLSRGRNISPRDVETGMNVAVLGSEVVRSIFDTGVDPLDKFIVVGSSRFRVVGILAERGTSMIGGDNMVLIPVSNARQYFSRPNMNFSINIMPDRANLLDIASGEAEGLFRIIRNLRPGDQLDFRVVKSDSLVNMLLENIRYVTLAATYIGLITLFGAAIGLMNIMLVSVSERTMEIGVRKAIGAKSGAIRNQFLLEAILIGQIGGAAGIVLGIMIGNVVSLLTGAPFIVPWIWILSGVLLCLLVGLVSGYLPAVRASRLDPIVALRYE